MKIVLKVGGEVVRSGAIAPIARDLDALRTLGHTVVVVHGGGPQATELQHKLGIEPNLVAGRRITDAPTLEVMKMAVAGAVNVDVCAALTQAGARPVGLHGASSLVLRAVRRPPRVVPGAGPEPIDFGFVGDIIGLERTLLDALIERGFTPVLASLAADDAGNVLNVNADAVASRVAVELGADWLALVSDVPGVLADANDPGSRIPELRSSDLERAVNAGTITRGMIPKLSEGFAALRAGVGAVLVIGQLKDGELVRAVTSRGTLGTVLLG